MEQIKRFCSLSKRAVLPCCLFFALCGAAAAAVQADRAGYEQALAQKAEGAIAGLLGPGQAKVLVRFTAESPVAAGAQSSAAEEAAAPAGRLTVFIALNDQVTEADAQKAREAISGALGLAPARGDELLVMKPGFAPGQAEPAGSGGLGKYAAHGLSVLAGLFIALIFSRLKRAGGGAAAARAPVSPALAEDYLPPPMPVQPRTWENEELKIPSRNGFYKR